MQVGQHHRLRRGRQDVADFLHHGRVHLGIQQHPAAVAQQAQGPDGHQHRTDQAHGRVQPGRTPEHAAQQGQDGQHRGGRVRDHVQVGRAQVQVFGRVGMGVAGGVVPVVMTVLVAMMVVVAAAQQPSAGQIHRQAQAGQGDGLGVIDGQGRAQPVQGLHRHPARHEQQQDGAGVARQHFQLPGAEGEAAVARQAPRRHIGPHRQAQRQGV